MEHWVEINLNAEIREQDRILLDVLGPYVRRLEGEGELVTYHYFREPEIRLRVRLRTKAAKVRQMVALSRIADSLVKQKAVSEWYFGDHGEKKGSDMLAKRTGTGRGDGRWPRTISGTARKLP